ncbi:MAG: S-layer homology domain-containing protein [Tissierellia bacterium]|nr:S-layer homology domain-containing protein [Tissierellia bacterium]
MKKLGTILLVLLLLITNTVTAQEISIGSPSYLKVSAGKDGNGNYDKFILSWKNSNEVLQGLNKGQKIEYEIDLKNNGNPWHSEIGKGTEKRSITVNGDGRTEVFLTEDNFASVEEFDIFTSNYSFRVRYILNGKPGNFSTYSTLGLRPNYKNNSKWATEELNKANSLGLLSPVVKEDLRKNITREEFIDACVRGYEKSMGQEVSADNNIFKDTKNPSVIKGANLKIVQGDGKGYFKPNDPITREEMAIMTINYLKAKSKLPNFVSPKKFKDEDKTSSWAKKAVETLGGLGLAKGDPSGTFRPKDKVSREEGIILVLRSTNF